MGQIRVKSHTRAGKKVKAYTRGNSKVPKTKRTPVSADGIAKAIIDSPKIGNMFKDMARINPKEMAIFIAQQAQGLGADWKPVRGGPRRSEAESQFGKEVVRDAIKFSKQFKK